MHPLLILQLLILLIVANGTPIVAKRVLGDRFAWPLDSGATLADGLPLFGPAKTIRGVLFSVLVTVLAAMLLGLGWTIGVVAAVAAMAGDLFSSFVKRRLGLKASSMAIGFDHIPESLLPLLCISLLLPLTLADIVLATALFVVGVLVLSRVLFRLGVRDRPY